MMRTAIRPILVVAPVGWVVALLLAVFIASRPSVGLPAYAVSASVYEIGSLLCHQFPERSFHLWGAQFPVCARCTGLYLGAALAAVAAAGISRSDQRTIWDRARTLGLVAAFPTVATLLYEWIGGRMPSHWIRAAAGFPLGAMVMLIVFAATTSESVVEIH